MTGSRKSDHLPDAPSGLLFSRRELLRAGVGLGALGMVPGALLLPAQALAAQARADGKVLVVLELSGGNDGLNTIVPHGDDAYYRHRPGIGLAKRQLRPLDDHFGFNPGMAGLERLYKEGHVAIVHGCGYSNPSYSHFTSMAYWHTAAPNSGEAYGWIGRLADTIAPAAPAGYLVNIAASQSLAVRSQRHVPVVFDDPERFLREAFHEEHQALAMIAGAGRTRNASQNFLRDIARSASDASDRVRQAWAGYRPGADYGIAGLDLPKVVALLESGMDTRLFYVGYRNNAFDTHVFQNDLHQRLLTYTSDAISAFMQDLERIGRADDVVLLVFSEFGRRVTENVSLGTDHGTANVMFVIGKPVKGGHYGEAPSLTRLAPDGNLLHTTDFRRVYQTLIEGWLGHRDASAILGGDFGRFDLFA